MPLALVDTIALLGGFVPALVWLLFWLMEDRCNPEPKRYIALCFFGGMLAVPLVLPLEQIAQDYTSGLMLFVVWAALEELSKFGVAYLFALRSAAFDEPLDAIIYLATAALGFSALENAFFLWTPLHQGEVARTILTGDLRFMGATLLHTLASATVGVLLALSFYKRAHIRKIYALVGVILAVFLHTLFNFFILTTESSSTLWIFMCVWVGIITILLLTERIKQPRDYC